MPIRNASSIEKLAELLQTPPEPLHQLDTVQRSNASARRCVRAKISDWTTFTEATRQPLLNRLSVFIESIKSFTAAIMNPRKHRRRVDKALSSTRRYTKLDSHSYTKSFSSSANSVSIFKEKLNLDISGKRHEARRSKRSGRRRKKHKWKLNSTIISTHAWNVAKLVFP
jgi:hypothetical protein